MDNFDLCLAWEWPYDTDFVHLLDAACRNKGLSLLQITPQNVDWFVQAVRDGQVAFRAVWDRASDVDARFRPLLEWARLHRAYRINRLKFAQQSWNKAVTHQILTEAGLHTPTAMVLPSFQEQPDLPPLDLEPLGRCFSIKPAHGGGGRGVVVGATTWGQVQEARRQYPGDQYLLQANVEPAQISGRPAWFRMIYCAGAVFPCWWNTQTHVYTPVTPAEMEDYSLWPLVEISHFIARLSHMELFSTEIAHTADGSFILIDYVNDPLDLRLQSVTCEGVPDGIVAGVAERVATLVAVQLEERTPPEDIFCPTRMAHPIYVTEGEQIHG